VMQVEPLAASISGGLRSVTWGLHSARPIRHTPLTAREGSVLTIDNALVALAGRASSMSTMASMPSSSPRPLTEAPSVQGIWRRKPSHVPSRRRRRSTCPSQPRPAITDVPSPAHSLEPEVEGDRLHRAT